MSFDEIWDRITQETDLKTFNDLASLVGSTQPHISRKKKRNEFSAEWAVTISNKYNIHTDWILRGIGPKKIGSVEMPKYKFQYLVDIDRWLSELLADDRRSNDWFEVTFEECFPMFKEWKKRREGKESDDTHSADENIA